MTGWDDTRGTRLIPRQGLGGWLGGLLVVAVLLGACWVADALGYVVAGGS